MVLAIAVLTGAAPAQMESASELILILRDQIDRFLRQQAADDDDDDLAERAQQEATEERLDGAGQQHEAEERTEKAEEPLDERIAQRRALEGAVCHGRRAG